MRHLILCSTVLLLTMPAGAQSAHKIRTITTLFAKNGSISGDTTFFNFNNYNNSPDGLRRYFNRNLRVPMVVGTDEMELGACNLYFIVDTAGRVTKTWCDSVTNKAVEKEVLRVAGKLPAMRPTMIKGKPVFTQVMTTVKMEHANDQEVYGKADILVIAWDVVHKKAVSR